MMSVEIEASASPEGGDKKKMLAEKLCMVLKKLGVSDGAIEMVKKDLEWEKKEEPTIPGVPAPESKNDITSLLKSLM